MSEDNNELENLDGDSFADFDSLSDFAEFEDLTTLEGMEEFADVLDSEELNDAGMDLPATEEKMLAAAMEKKASMSELFEDDTLGPGEDLFLDENLMADEGPMASKVSLPDDTSSMDDLSMPEDDLSLDDLSMPEDDLSLDDLSVPEDDLSLDDLSVPEDDLSLDDLNMPEDDLSLDDLGVSVDDLLLDDPDDADTPGEDLSLDDLSMPGDDLALDDLSMPEDDLSLDDLGVSVDDLLLDDSETPDDLSLDDLGAPEDDLSVDDISLPEDLSLDDLGLPEEDDLSLDDDLAALDKELDLGDAAPSGEDLSLDDDLAALDKALDFETSEEELSMDDFGTSEEELSMDDFGMPEEEFDLGDTALLDEELDLGDTALLDEEMGDMPLPEEEGFSGQDDISGLEDTAPDDDFILDSLLAEDADLASLDRMLELDNDSAQGEEEVFDSASADASADADAVTEMEAEPMPDMMPELEEEPIPEVASEMNGMSELDAIPEAEEVSMATDSEAISTEDEDLDSMLDGILDDLDMDDLDMGESASKEESALPGDDDDELFGLLDETDLDQAEDLMEVDLPESETRPKEEKEPGLLKRLFGNIVTDEIAEAERQELEEEQAQAEKQAELDAKAKEEKAAAKAAKAEEKAAAKAAKAEEKAAAKAEKAKLKAERKAKQKEEEEKEAQYEITGKLNKIGVGIVVACTLIFLVTEIAGTNLHSNLRIKKTANSYFELGRYTEAYQEVLGTNLQKKDPDTYNKIKTVMQVQRAINAYDNYNEMNYYPDALNALLRGLQRYDANVENAKKYEVLSDLDQCKVQITGLLQSEFGVSESEASTLLSLDKEQYTKRVVELAMARH